MIIYAMPRFIAQPQHTMAKMLSQSLLDRSTEELAKAIPESVRLELEPWSERVRMMVKPKRYGHILRVAHLAHGIALAQGLDADRAFTAGLLHDIARDVTGSELLRLAPPECAIDANHALAVHGRAGRALLSRWGYNDTLVLEAVEDHTTGPRAGNLISAVVYIADVSEPGRGVNHDIREMAFSNLGAALEKAICTKVEYLQGRGISVHPRTLAVYQGIQSRLQSNLDTNNNAS